MNDFRLRRGVYWMAVAIIITILYVSTINSTLVSDLAKGSLGVLVVVCAMIGYRYLGRDGK